MNKQNKIAVYKQILESAQNMQAVAMQNFSLAARLESEARSELEVLGTSAPARKGKRELAPEMMLKLQAQLTK